MSENRDVQKTLINMVELKGTTRAAIDVLNPIIEVSGLNANEYNYCYIKELNRYYYIENKVIATNGICRMTMRVDVLMSFIDDIKASSGLITRQRDYNPYYGKYETEPRTDVTKYEFNDVFDKIGVYVLTALRG